LRVGELTAAAGVNVCLCLSLVPAFIQADVVAQAAVRVLGEAAVTATLNALINTVPDHQTCVYSAHAHALCVPSDPCAFECTDGYSIAFSGSNPICTCPAPSTECNGQCGYFPGGCASAVAVPARRSVGASPKCVGGEVCGVRKGKGKGWECVNTRSDLESCGGCTTPSPFDSGVWKAGVDCSVIANVEDVSCSDGKCIVRKCGRGYTPSHSAEFCVPTEAGGRPHGLGEIVRMGWEVAVGSTGGLGGRDGGENLGETAVVKEGVEEATR